VLHYTAVTVSSRSLERQALIGKTGNWSAVSSVSRQWTIKLDGNVPTPKDRANEPSANGIVQQESLNPAAVTWYVMTLRTGVEACCYTLTPPNVTLICHETRRLTFRPGAHVQ
jgi:hypothetical protein